MTSDSRKKKQTGVSSTKNPPEKKMEILVPRYPIHKTWHRAYVTFSFKQDDVFLNFYILGR